MIKSEQIELVAAALCKAQGEMENVHKNSQGYGYKYADLASILTYIKPILYKHELCITQLPFSSIENEVIVETILMHSSGQFIGSSTKMQLDPNAGKMSIPQRIGTCISYARRYAICSMLNLAQEDNDAAVEQHEPTMNKKYHKKEDITENEPEIYDATSVFKYVVQKGYSNEFLNNFMKEYGYERFKDLDQKALKHLVYLPRLEK